jgi:hypothetical protein
VVVVVGDTVIVAVACPPDHRYVEAPEAVRSMEDPEQIVGVDGFVLIEIDGNGFTVVTTVVKLLQHVPSDT